MTDPRLLSLAEQVEAQQISRREFVRQAAIVTGSTAAGLHTLSSMAGAQPKTKMRVWLFKSFVTDCNENINKHIDQWAAERQADVDGAWLPLRARQVQLTGQYYAIGQEACGGGLQIRKDLGEAKAVKMPKVYGPD